MRYKETSAVQKEALRKMGFPIQQIVPVVETKEESERLRKEREARNK